MVWWLSSVSTELCQSARAGSNPVWGNLSFFPPTFVFTASSCQLKVSNLFLTTLGYYMELMKGLDEADKVHIYWTKLISRSCWTLVRKGRQNLNLLHSLPHWLAKTHWHVLLHTMPTYLECFILMNKTSYCM